MRDREGWSQQELGEKVGMNQNAISRLENPNYGKPTITTLKRLAAIFDVAVIVRFVPFTQLVAWVSGTEFRDKGLSSESLVVPRFGQETASILGQLSSLPMLSQEQSKGGQPEKQPKEHRQHILALGPLKVTSNEFGAKTA